MTSLVFFLEEPSAKAMLEVFLPKILPEGIACYYFTFEGKSDLEKRLPKMLRYWQKPNCRFIVLRDQDSANCEEIKTILKEKCLKGAHPDALVRIACRELEAWYLGDLIAVENAYDLSGIAARRRTKKLRNPDEVMNPSAVLKDITKQKYLKVDGSRMIGKFLERNRNTSHSFRVLWMAS